MNNFYIIANSMKDPGFVFSKEIAQFLEKNGKKCIAGGDSREPIPEDVDCILVLGGDGTVLHAAYAVLGRDTPLLGINLGTLGYLAQVEKKNWQKALLQLLSGDFTIEERMMLEGVVPSGKTLYALNDVVFARSGALQILNLDVYVNDQYLNTFNADGIIVSTPTGSTAYNLSAGGPIVEPDAKLILLTPICPHTLNTSPVVLSAQDKVEVRIGSTSTARVLKAEVHFDGDRSQNLKTGDRVTIRKSERTTRLIKLDKRSFLETLHKKMANIT